MGNARLRILLYSRQDAIGGTERRMYDLYEYLKSCNVDVSIYFSIGKGRSDSRIHSNLVLRLIKLMRILLLKRPNVVHAFDIESGIYASILNFPFLRFKIISGYGAEFITVKKTKFLLGKGWFLPDLYLCNSEKACISLRSYLKKDRPIRFYLNGLGSNRLEVEHILNESLEKKLKNKYVIGYIGKLDNIKHGERILDLAIHMLTNSKFNKPLHFLIIGNGPNYLMAKEKLENLDQFFKDSISILGQVSNAAQLIKIFDLGVLCSDSEGLPNVLLEYMYFGKPWVSTDVGDVKSLNNNGASGLIIKEYSQEGFSSNIELLLNKKELYSDLSRNGFENFRLNYSIERMGNEYLIEYNKIINDK